MTTKQNLMASTAGQPQPDDTVITFTFQPTRMIFWKSAALASGISTSPTRAAADGSS